MDFRGLVWKRVWKITFFGLKSGKDLKNRAAHPDQELLGEPLPRAQTQEETLLKLQVKLLF